MGGTVSIDNSVLETQLRRFRKLLEEPIGTTGWQDEEMIGIHTQLSSKIDDSSKTYWRGVVDVNAPLEIILWVIRNQAETFDGLADVSVSDYLDSDVNEYAAKRTCEASFENSDGLRTLRWTQELPKPARKREFVTTEIVHEMDNVTYAIQTSETLDRHLQRTTRKNSAGHLRQLRASLSDLRSRSSASLKRASSILKRMSEVELNSRRTRSRKPSALESSSKRRGSKYDKGLIRGEVVVHGYALEALTETRTRVSCLSCIDLLLDHLDFEGVDPIELSDVFKAISGVARVLMDVERLYRYFTEPQALLVERLYRLASAEVGDLGFEELFGKERRKVNDLQTGTHVLHKFLGHGVVTRFDMYGNTFAQFDNGMRQKFSSQEIASGELEVVVEVGTRVSHTLIGKGTVKQFDDDGNIHVKFDASQQYEVFSKADWDKSITVMKDEKVVGTGGTGNVSMSKRINGIRENKSSKLEDVLPTPLYRISFIIGSPVNQVLAYIAAFKEDETAGNILKDYYLDSKHTRSSYFTEDKNFSQTKIRYQLRKMSQPLNERDFVFAETAKRVDSNTFVLLQYSVNDDSKPPEQGIVRGNVLTRGCLLEPVYENRRNPFTNFVKGRRLSTVPSHQELNSKYTRVTYVSCVDVGGFVPPKTAETEAEIELLGVLTELRAHFYQRRQASQTGLKSTSKHVSSAKSRRVVSKRLDPRSNSKYSVGGLGRSKKLTGSSTGNVSTTTMLQTSKIALKKGHVPEA